MQRIAIELKLDPLEVIRRNLVPQRAIPYRTATGALLDSGRLSPPRSRPPSRDGGLAELQARRDAARAKGRLYGIGFAAVVEPSVSNMGYITTVLTPEERRSAGPKNGAQATATISLDPLGAVSVQVASAPQGQGHRTVLAQVVADAFGLKPHDIRVVADMDTAKDAWSIASGNYSSRFAPAVAGAAADCRRALARPAGAARRQRSSTYRRRRSSSPRAASPRAQIRTTRISFARVAAAGHWAPGTIPPNSIRRSGRPYSGRRRELTAPNDADEINSSLCHGFIFDFCGVEIDRATGAVRIDKYVTMHDCGRILHPAMVAGQISGGFAQALGAALYEEYV